MRAIVVGATGAVGSSLVRDLLESPKWEEVTILTRRLVNRFGDAPKLRVRVIEMADLERETAAAAVESIAAFCTMGVGQPRKSPKEEVWRVDVEWAAAFARGARAAGVQQISLLSSTGADAQSKSYYLRVKGSAEAAVREATIPSTNLFRPSLLVTRQTRYGMQDAVTQFIMPRISWLLPSRFHEIHVEDLARAMRINAERPMTPSVKVLHYAEMMALLDGSM